MAAAGKSNARAERVDLVTDMKEAEVCVRARVCDLDKQAFVPPRYQVALLASIPEPPHLRRHRW